MLIWRFSDWRVESDGYICGQHLTQINDLRALRRISMQTTAAETSRLAERARQARRRAIARGYAAGRAAALHNLVVPTAATAFALARLKECLVRIAMKAIAEIVDELPPGIILPVQLRRSLQAAPGHHLLSVRVATSDLDEARLALGAVEQELGLSLVTVLADADLPPGSCVVETDCGMVDGGLRQQLAALERGVRDAIAAVLDEYTRMDDTLARQIDIVEQGLRDALDALSREAPPVENGTTKKRTTKRKGAPRRPTSSRRSGVAS